LGSQFYILIPLQLQIILYKKRSWWKNRLMCLKTILKIRNWFKS